MIDWTEQSVMKTIYDNDMTNCIDVFYTEIEIELSRPIEPGAVFYKNQNRINVIYVENETKLS